MDFMCPRLYGAAQAFSVSGESEDDQASAPDGRVYSALEGVAVIPVIGTLVHRSYGFGGAHAWATLFSTGRSNAPIARHDTPLPIPLENLPEMF